MSRDPRSDAGRADAPVAPAASGDLEPGAPTARDAYPGTPPASAADRILIPPEPAPAAAGETAAPEAATAARASIASKLASPAAGETVVPEAAAADRVSVTPEPVSAVRASVKAESASAAARAAARRAAGVPLAPVPDPPAACAACLRRSWLLGALAPNLELAWKQRRPLRDVLALSDAQLIAALGGGGRARLQAAYERFDPGALRAAGVRAGTQAVCRHDPRFPSALGRDDGAPHLLHVRATGGPALDRLCEALAAPTIAIVGTRAASPEGLEMARGLGRGLARAGVTVISGMALGIDSAAHAGALDGGGRTVAVLAGAAEIPYPRSKADLHRQILATSCAVSELPPGTAPHRWCFPARNRTIAALGAATLVVEGAERSGSLITADFASQLGREVAAVPGPALSARSRGSNGLLRDGAAVVLGVQDALDLVLDAARPMREVGGPGPSPLRVALEPELERLLEAVGDGRGTLPALARTPAEADAALVGLADLEARGLIRRSAGGRWIRAVDP